MSRGLRLALALALAGALALAAPAVAQTADCRPCTPGPFDAVEISGSAVVRFTQGPTDEVRIGGDADAQGGVDLQVRDGVLHIRPPSGWKFWSGARPHIDIAARELRRVAISGAADFAAMQPVRSRALEISISGSGLARFDRLQADTLRFQVSGAGDGQVAGRVGDLQIAVSGRGEFRGENLLSRRAKVAVAGVGEVRVWATEWLGIHVSGVGTVDYWGTPLVERHSSGIAKIHEHGAKPLPP